MKLYPSRRAKKALLKLFNEEQLGLPIGKAFVGLTIIVKNGQRYGSFHTINCEQLVGRHYTVELWDGRPHVLLLDTFFDPEAYPNVLAYHMLPMYKLRLRYRYKKMNKDE